MSRFPLASWVCSAGIALAIVLPWMFFDWHTGRHSGFMVSMLSQMGMMIILALSYNMLLGQAGLFSLCHATFFGMGGYSTVHFLNAVLGGTPRIARATAGPEVAGAPSSPKTAFTCSTPVARSKRGSMRPINRSP